MRAMSSSGRERKPVGCDVVSAVYQRQRSSRRSRCEEERAFIAQRPHHPEIRSFRVRRRAAVAGHE